MTFSTQIVTKHKHISINAFKNKVKMTKLQRSSPSGEYYLLKFLLKLNNSPYPFCQSKETI